MDYKNNSNKKEACTDKIDTGTNSITIQSFDDQNLQDSRMDTGLETAQQQHGDPHDPEDKLQNLYKTEICRNWEEQGTCRYGAKCQYAHGNHELRYVQRHPRYKTIHCRSFESTGACPYGKRCTFLHEQRSPPPEQLSRGCQQEEFTLPLDQDTPTVSSSTRQPLFVTCKSTSSAARLAPLEGTITTAAAQNITIPRSSPPLVDSVTTPTPNPSLYVRRSSASTHISAHTLTLLQYHHQYPQQAPNQLDPSVYCDHYQLQYHHQQQRQQQHQKQQCQLSPTYFYNQTTRPGSCLTKDLFTDTGGFSCAFGLSPPLLSPSNSNIQSSSSYFSSQFSPSSSTVTASSSSSSSTTAIDPKHHLLQ